MVHFSCVRHGLRHDEVQAEEQRHGACLLACVAALFNAFSEQGLEAWISVVDLVDAVIDRMTCILSYDLV